MVCRLKGENMKKFSMAICVKSGTVNGHNFNEGDIYPILGLNNGVHICYTDEEVNNGDPHDLLCHGFGYLAPVEGKQFMYQDGTIPPLFDYYEDEWIDANEKTPEYDAVASAKYSPCGETSSKRVLVTVEGQIYPKKEKRVLIARYCYDKFIHGKPKGWIIANNTYGKVTAWKPLPEPYEGKL